MMLSQQKAIPEKSWVVWYESGRFEMGFVPRADDVKKGTLMEDQL